MSTGRRATARPFTVVCCEACVDERGLRLSDALRQSIRRCDHGALVISACLLGRLTCATGRRGAGATLVLQPCSIDRRPIGPARWIGPIKDSDDVGVLRDWLEQGEWNPQDLPDRMRAELTVASGYRN